MSVRTLTNDEFTTMTATNMSPSGRQYIGAGIILMRPTADGGEMEYLLLQGCSGVWSFPKGHPEATDRGSPLRTAVRETYEETGFLCDRDYNILGNSMRFGKRPYWLGLVSSAAPPRLAATEHSGYAWMTAGAVRGLENTNGDVRAWAKKTESTASQFCRMLIDITQRITSSATSSTQATQNTAVECNGS